MEENDGHERDGQPPFIHLVGSDTPRLKFGVWPLVLRWKSLKSDRQRRELEASTKKDVYVDPKIHWPPAAAAPPSPPKYNDPPPKYDAPPPKYGVTEADEKRDHGPKRK